MRTLAWPSRFALFLLCALLCANSPAAEPTPPLASDSVYQLRLPLVDQSARHSDWQERRGQPQLVAMFYTSCQYICPLIIDSARAVERALDASQRSQLRVLLISMDPKRDTPAALLKVMQQRHLDAARWTLASPDPADVRAVAGVLGVRYRALADGEFNHTSALVLLDGEGRILARTERMGSQVDPEFLGAVKKVLRAPAP